MMNEEVMERQGRWRHEIGWVLLLLLLNNNFLRGGDAARVKGGYRRVGNEWD